MCFTICTVNDKKMEENLGGTTEEDPSPTTDRHAVDVAFTETEQQNYSLHIALLEYLRQMI